MYKDKANLLVCSYSRLLKINCGMFAFLTISDYFCNEMKQGTILIVDDNRNILTTVKMLLEDTFEKTVAIANPNNIPAKLRDERPDVVLLDMNFQSGINNGNEGLYWLRHIRKTSPQTQVVLFTAYADIELAVTGIKEGAADFIVKPFDNAKLIATLTEAYKKKHAGKSTAAGDEGRMYWGTSPRMATLRSTVEKVAALSHSGWKGTAARMGRHMLGAMKEAFGSKPSEIYAAIGPSICQKCYEVSQDVAEIFFREFPQSQKEKHFIYRKDNGKYQLNLWRANEIIFLEEGIPKEHISFPGICTCCNPELLFSHRASKGKRGNLSAFLEIRPSME